MKVAESHIFSPVLQGNSLQAKIVIALEKIGEAFRVLQWDKAKQFGVSPLQLQIVIFVKNHPLDMCKVAFLAQEFNVTKATISDAVKALVQKDILIKKTDLTDSRCFLLLLTDKGSKMVSQLEQYPAEVEHSINRIEGVGGEDMMTGLMEIIWHLNKLNVITQQRMCFTCTHFHQITGEGQYCNFLNVALENRALQLDCPDYQRGA